MNTNKGRCVEDSRSHSPTGLSQAREAALFAGRPCAPACAAPSACAGGSDVAVMVWRQTSGQAKQHPRAHLTCIACVEWHDVKIDRFLWWSDRCFIIHVMRFRFVLS